MRRLRHAERGSGLVICILAVTVFAIMAGTLYALARTQVRESVFQLRQIQAHYIAEAGLETTLERLQTLAPKDVHLDDESFAGGSFSVTVSTAPPIEITSIGHSPYIFPLGSVSQTLRAKLRTGNAGPQTTEHVGWVPGSWAIGRRR